MRSDEKRKDPEFKRHGIRLKVRRFLLRITGGLPVTYRGSLCSALKAISASNLKLPPRAWGPACIEEWAMGAANGLLWFGLSLRCPPMFTHTSRARGSAGLYMKPLTLVLVLPSMSLELVKSCLGCWLEAPLLGLSQ